MEIDSLIKKEHILLNPGSLSKDGLLEELCGFAENVGAIGNGEQFLKIIMNREKLGSTGIGKGIAIPHGRCGCVPKLSLIFARHDAGVDFDSLDSRPAHLFFLLAAPLNVESIYLQVLANLSMFLRNEKFRENLMKAANSDEIMEILRYK